MKKKTRNLKPKKSCDVKDAVKKHAGGRPTKYNPDFCDIVVEKMQQGAAIKELPYYLGVCVDTINEWRKVYPEFSAAIKKGEAFSEAFWMADGRESLRDSKFNSTLWYMNMKNRFGWADKTESKENVTVTETVTRIKNAKKAYETKE